MTDEIDRANDVADVLRSAALRQRKMVPSVVATGRCLNCHTDIKRDRRWCNAECRDTWEKENT